LSAGEKVLTPASAGKPRAIFLESSILLCDLSGRENTMIDAPRIAHTQDTLTAAIHITVPRAQIQEVMGPGLQELTAAVAAQGIKTTGPWFTHHLRMDPKVFHFEICLPVAAPVSPAGRVKPGRLPAAKVARTVYHGGYEGLGEAWGELSRWIQSEGLTPALDLWECYLAGPESGSDPAAWQTQLNKPLLG
jgi:effector-binding domain-containing protein